MENVGNTNFRELFMKYSTKKNKGLILSSRNGYKNTSNDDEKLYKFQVNKLEKKKKYEDVVLVVSTTTQN